MRIDHYDLQGEVQYRQQQVQSRKVRNLGPVPPAVNPPEGNNTAAAGERSSTLTLTSALTLQTARQSAASQQAATPPAPPAADVGKEQDGIPDDGLDNRQRLIKLMIEAMLGHEIELPKPINPSEEGDDGVAQGDAAAQATEPDQLVEVTDTLLQQEQLNVVASASVATRDGQTIQLDLGFVLDWRQLEVSQRRTTLNALKDPLVLSLDGKIADLTVGFAPQFFRFVDRFRNLLGDSVVLIQPLVAILHQFTMLLLELSLGFLGCGLALDVLWSLCPGDSHPVPVFGDVAAILAGLIDPLVELLDVGANRVQNGHIDAIGFQGFISLGGDFGQAFLEARNNALNGAINGS